MVDICKRHMLFNTVDLDRANVNEINDKIMLIINYIAINKFIKCIATGSHRYNNTAFAYIDEVN